MCAITQTASDWSQILDASNNAPHLRSDISIKDASTMEQTIEQFNQAKSKIVGDIKTVIADGEDLLKSAANASGAGIAVAREKMDDTICGAKKMLFDASRPAVDKARRTATTANHYVHDNPWIVIGIAVAAGALIGFMAAKR
jgi:ElaB/YqjD/DUF883 family membrane-anchored ribosome-binding protein